MYSLVVMNGSLRGSAELRSKNSGTEVALSLRIPSGKAGKLNFGSVFLLSDKGFTRAALSGDRGTAYISDAKSVIVIDQSGKVLTEGRGTMDPERYRIMRSRVIAAASGQAECARKQQADAAKGRELKERAEKLEVSTMIPRSDAARSIVRFAGELFGSEKRSDSALPVAEDEAKTGADNRFKEYDAEKRTAGKAASEDTAQISGSTGAGSNRIGSPFPGFFRGSIWNELPSGVMEGRLKRADREFLLRAVPCGQRIRRRPAGRLMKSSNGRLYRVTVQPVFLSR